MGWGVSGLAGRWMSLKNLRPCGGVRSNSAMAISLARGCFGVGLYSSTSCHAPSSPTMPRLLVHPEILASISPIKGGAMFVLDAS